MGSASYLHFLAFVRFRLELADAGFGYFKTEVYFHDKVNMSLLISFLMK